MPKHPHPTPEGRLILTAALRYDAEMTAAKRPKEMGLASARLNAFGQVAADVFGMAMTPFAFEEAIRQTLRAMPHPNPHATKNYQAVRAVWTTEFVKAVQNLLGVLA